MGNDHSADSDTIDVTYVAHLARLHLSDEETATFQAQLGDIVDYVRKLREVSTDGVEPMSHAVTVQNVFREDEPGRGLDHDDVMDNAPAQSGGLFKVPKIVE